MKWLIDVEWPEAGRDPGDQYEVIGIVEAETVEDALSLVRLGARKHVTESSSSSSKPTADEIGARR